MMAYTVGWHRIEPFFAKLQSRVEEGRGRLGHAASLHFPSPLIEPDVRISPNRLCASKGKNTEKHPDKTFDFERSNEGSTCLGTHFSRDGLRVAKATLIYRRTGNLRAVQLLLGHTKIESTVR